MPSSQGLDHIYIRVDELEPALHFFHGQLGLPLTWPMRDEAFARYAWVNAGNVQLELWEARSNDDLPPGTRLPCVAGLALWPANVHESYAELVGSGVACKQPKAWRTPRADGVDAVNFTNCLVADASGPACQVFFCGWDANAPVVPWPKGQSTQERRDHMAAALALCKGGTLGLTGLRAVHMESPTPAHSTRVWQLITGSEGIAAPGVSLRIAHGAELRISALVFGVDDIARSIAALSDIEMPVQYDEGLYWISTARTHGLCIGLESA